MTARLLGALALSAIGAFANVPVVTVIGLFAIGLELVRMTWARRGLNGVRYSRELATQRVNWGDLIEMKIEVWNRKRLPLAWLRAVEDVSTGVLLRRTPLAVDSRILNLDNTWTLAPYERVLRRVWIGADERGYHSVGPIRLSVGDLFGREVASLETDSVIPFIVWPRVVPAPGIARPDRWGDLDRARAGLLDDPARFAGVRPYSPGDPLRRVHARTSARVGRPITKRFEPSREREFLLALDIQTAGGSRWEIAAPDSQDVETLFVIAASVVRRLDAEGAALGLTAAGFTRTTKRFADVPVGRGAHHADRLLDVLARLTPYPSASFGSVLGRIPWRFGQTTTVIVLTMRSPQAYLGEMRVLRRAGYGVVVLSCGRSAAHDAVLTRRAGFSARAVQLDGPWQTATELAAAA